MNYVNKPLNDRVNTSHTHSYHYDSRQWYQAIWHPTVCKHEVVN